VASQVPLRRVGAADEVAGTAVFLASADSSFITGSEIAVDGGLAQV
jgi:NAD(P)-dependent dehydrogenase (short-subunit alcohol dehydrogenase family)